MSMPLALISLSPPFLIVAYMSVLMVRRELTILFGFLGQLACEAFNLILKRTFKQGRPTTFLGTGYGMPSSHSQFVGYFAAFWTLHLLRNRPGMSRKRRGGTTSMIDVLRSAEHFILLALINVGSLATAYSRYHLSYHSPIQIAVGAGLGVACGVGWYVVCEVYAHKRALGFSRSIRRTLLDNPFFVALRIRDSWAVWDDAGIEAEYGFWRGLWNGLEKQEDESSLSPTEHDIHHMLYALRLASRCDETTTAFSVGCVVCHLHSQEVLSTGFSREQPGNTHAEEVALDKLTHKAEKVKHAKTSEDVPLTLYTTMEPCSERLSKKDACVQRILQFNAANVVDRRSGGRLVVRRIVQGVREPEDFVQCVGTRMLEDNGLQVDHLRPGNVYRHARKSSHHVLKLEDGWLEREAVRLAKFGHPDQPSIRGEEDRVWKEESWLPYEEEAPSRPAAHTRQGDNLRSRSKR